MAELRSTIVLVRPAQGAPFINWKSGNEASIAKVAALKCDVIVSVHPGFTRTMDKQAARTAARNPFIDPEGCRAYAADARARLSKRIARERGWQRRRLRPRAGSFRHRRSVRCRR